MTEQRPATRTRKRGRPSPLTVLLGSLAAFLAILAFLAFQVRAGHDPALSRTAAVVQVQQPRRAVVRKIEDDYVVTKVIPAPQSTTSPQPALTTGSSGGGGASVSSSPAPVITSSPAPAPAPAPTPAPVTRTS